MTKSHHVTRFGWYRVSPSFYPIFKRFLPHFRNFSTLRLRLTSDYWICTTVTTSRRIIDPNPSTITGTIAVTAVNGILFADFHLAATFEIFSGADELPPA